MRLPHSRPEHSTTSPAMHKRNDSGLPSSASRSSSKDSRVKDMAAARGKRKLAEESTPTNKKPAPSRRRSSNKENLVAVEAPAIDRTPKRPVKSKSGKLFWRLGC